MFYKKSTGLQHYFFCLVGVDGTIKHRHQVLQGFLFAMHLDDVAIDWPDMQIVMAHPSFPWQDEALSVAMHKPNVWIDLSGWSPKYFPKQLVQYANTLLKDRVLFGSDYPLITPERWMKDFEVAGFRPEVMPGILKDNAVRLLGLDV